MIRNQLKNLLKLGCLLFGMSCLVINCKQDDLITYEAHKEINAKTVSFKQAKAFFENAQNKSQNAKSESDKSSSKELVLDPDWNSLEHSNLVYTEAKLTKANTEVNRDGAFTSKLLFVNIDDEIKSIVLTTWITEYDLEDNIVNATIYFNDYEGRFIDAYKIENGLFTERLKPKPHIQTASFLTFFQGKEDDDCWNTDNLPEDGQLEAVNLGVIPSGSGGGGYSGIGTGLPPGVTSAGGYGGYINSGVNSGGGLVTGSGGTSITTGGIDIGATTIIMNPPIQPDDEGKCPPGYTKDPKTGECIALCSGGKVYDATTKTCKCPHGKVEDDDGNCVEEDDDCDTSKEDLKKVFPNMTNSDAELLAKLINDKGKDFGINSDEKLWHFLSQAGHETGGFKTLNVTESTYWRTASKLATTYTKFTMDSTKAKNNANLYYAPDYLKNSSGVANIAMCCDYGNGDVASGDGYKYRGRGIFQLTWKDNYKAFKTWYNKKYDPDIDPVKTPDILASNDTLAILSGLWYYKTRVIDRVTIDSTTTVIKVTKPINSGYSGIDDRKERFKKAKDSINCL